MSTSPDRLQLIRRTFTAAIELPQSERAAYLDRTCGADQELLTEVQSLLRATERTEGRWDQPAAAVKAVVPSTGGDGTLWPIDPGSRLNSVVGAYNLVRLLGEGGMGAVYEGRRADETFEKRVAIKFPRWGLLSPHAVQRFERERTILASLEHRNIAGLLDGGVLPNGQPYFIMEYVDGVPITQFVQERRSSVAARVQLMRQICRAVQHAHENLIIHRDLKPSNVLVTADGTVKLLDFGIARFVDDTTAPPITRGNDQALTIEYASPEQLRSAPLNTSSDVYSLGVLLYEILAGRRPFNLQHHALHEFIRLVCDTTPPTPSAIAATSTGSPLRIAPDLDSVTLTALRAEPAERYRSAQSMSDDLERFLEGRPVSAHSVSRWYRTKKWLGRHKYESAATALLLLSLLTGTVATYRQSLAAQREAATARHLANTLLFDVNDAITDLPGATSARAAMIAPSLAYLDRTAALSNTSPDLARELVYAYQRIGDVQGNPTQPNLGDFEGARATYTKGLAIAERHISAGTSSALMLRGYALLLERLADVANPAGELEEAVRLQRLAISTYEELQDSTPVQDNLPVNLAIARLKLGDVLGHPAFRNLGDTAGAMEQYRVALKDLDAIPPGGPDQRIDRNRALLLERMGRIAGDGGDPGALDLLQRSLAARERLLAEQPASINLRRDVAIAHFLICGLSLQQGNAEQALAPCLASEAERTALYREDPGNVSLVRGMGLIHRRLGDIRARLGAQREAADNYRLASAFYDTLASRGAATATDSSERAALRALTRRRVLASPTRR